MTEFEIATLALQKAEGIRAQIQLVQAQGELMYNSSTTFITLLSGYLVVAYLVGARLAKSELVVLNGLYAFFIVQTGWSMETAHSAGIAHHKILLELQPEREKLAFWTMESLLVSQAFIYVAAVASLYFMWSVRHPKSE